MTVDDWLTTHPGPDTHWCPICARRVEPVWMLVPNADDLVAYHDHNGSRHAVTGRAQHYTPGAPARELISINGSRFVASGLDD